MNAIIGEDNNRGDQDFMQIEQDEDSMSEDNSDDDILEIESYEKKSNGFGSAILN